MKTESLRVKYENFLISHHKKALTTEMSLLHEDLSHDKITRFLMCKNMGNRELRMITKKTASKQVGGVLIIDDMLVEKPYMKENELVSWYWDHGKQRYIKGINIISCVYQSNTDFTIPQSAHLIKKTSEQWDKKRKKIVKKSLISKNEYALNMIKKAIHNDILFTYVLADSWYCSAENMTAINTLCKKYIFEIKDNRRVSENVPSTNKGQYKKLSELEFQENETKVLWLKGMETPVLICLQKLKNENGSTIDRYLVSNDLDLSAALFEELYQKRWKIEEYHKSLKQNLSIGQCQARTVKIQINHFYLCISAFFRLEHIRHRTNINHFAIKKTLYISSLKASHQHLTDLSVA